MRRHNWVSTFALLFLLGLGWWTGPATAQELKFGFTPVLSEAEMRAEFDPLMAYLSDAIGQKATLYIAKDYGDLRTQMEAGLVHIGSFSPFAYVDAARGGRIRIIAQSKKKLTGHVIAEDSLFDVVRRTAKIAGM
jgi:ABC-type phosphate/phosphonate transport system substrate-binding protein